MNRPVSSNIAKDMQTAGLYNITEYRTVKYVATTISHNVTTDKNLTFSSHGLSIDYVQSELHKRTFINRMIFSNCY